jgi:hypothetical protein
MTDPWHLVSREPIPVGRVVQGRKADGTVVIGRTRQPGNALTDRDGVRHVVYHWSALDRAQPLRAVEGGKR